MEIFIYLFFAIFCLVSTTMLIYTLYQRKKSRVAATWPTTPGKIITCDRKIEYGDNSSDQVLVSYRYSVNETVHTATRIAFGYQAINARDYQDPIQERLRVGTQILVHYNPAKPREATLATGLLNCHKNKICMMLLTTIAVAIFVLIVLIVLQPDNTANAILLR